MCRILWLILLLASFTSWAGPLVQFRTVYGDIDVELFEDKPVTTQNFLRYIKSGFYRDMFFHRLAPNFVVQGGGYNVANRGTTNWFFYANTPFPAITNEYLVGRRISNTFGTIAMAKVGGNPNSATSEFFFNLTNNAANLDNQNGGFTVFGTTLRGTNILRRFNFPAAATNHIGIYDTRPGLPFDSLPLLANTGNDTDLIYVDISLLNVQVKLGTGQQREISWISVAGRSNFVEYTFLTNMPPKWFPIATNIGNGTTNKVIDASPSNTNRFYRVRVDYPANPLP